MELFEDAENYPFWSFVDNLNDYEGNACKLWYSEFIKNRHNKISYHILNALNYMTSLKMEAIFIKRSYHPLCPIVLVRLKNQFQTDIVISFVMFQCHTFGLSLH